MGLFKNAHYSHQHSLRILNLIYEYDSFLDSLESVADFGCGAGLDTKWWATLATRDDPPEPRNYVTYAVDKSIKNIEAEVKNLSNVIVIEADFDDFDPPVPRPVDLIWCHDTFQFVTNPLSTLRSFNYQLNINGMLLLIFPQHQYYEYNRINYDSRDGCFYNHNIVNLMYMLAVNGFDCSDAYFKKDNNDPWIYACVYKSHIDPMNPKSTTWLDLLELGLVNESVASSINKYGYVKQEELLIKWLDKDFKRLKE